MKSKINGYAYGGKFGNLKKILRKWVELNEQFFIQTGDGPLEEFSAKKNQKGKERAGRTDVYLNLGNSKFACEAKFIWLSVNSTDAISRIDQALEKACENAEENYKTGTLLGVCFVTVYVTAKNLGKFDDLIEELQKRICSELEFDAIAWSFPARAREALKGEKDKRLHPGSFLILRSCD
jgi:hypothetical protein